MAVRKSLGQLGGFKLAVGGDDVDLLGVVLTDSGGNEVSVGGGTQYTEDAAAAADPIGNMLIARRKDALATNQVSADGDNIALNATNKGQLHTFAEGPQTNAEFLAALRSTATHSSVASGTSSVTILAANASRKGARIFNTDANNLFLDLSGGTAVAATRAQVKLAQNEGYDVPFGLTGLITGIWAADGSGFASVVEFA